MYQSRKVNLYMYEIVKEKKRYTLTISLSNQPFLEIYFFKNPWAIERALDYYKYKIFKDKR